MTVARATNRVFLILLYEPSWIAETISAIGVFLWSAFACLTTDLSMVGWAYLMPVLGLVFGPLRIALLFWLTPLPRVLAACCGFVWWGGLAYSLLLVNGPWPMAGAAASIAFGDVLTVAKFSALALLDDRSDQRDPT